MVAPMYGRIRTLTAQMRDETTVKKRREACNSLRTLLNDQRNRETLLQEATGKKALCAVWSMIIGAALGAANKTVNPSKKTTAKTYGREDLAMPYYMLLRLDEFAKFANTDSLLEGKHVRQLLTYCNNLMANDMAMDSAGDDVMNILDFMCSRPDFVVHFRTDQEMQGILAELQIPLADPDKHRFFKSAAKVFAALLHTCKTMGMGLHALIPQCLEVVGAWCEDRLNMLHIIKARGGVIDGVQHMFGAAASILSSHPEHAIYALSVWGKEILSLAKQCYPLGDSKKSKESIIDYFLAHLLVCQTAGKLQGLLPGDLGDVGDASLDREDIEKLIATVVSGAEIDKVRMGADVAKSQRKSAARTPISSREVSMDPTDLSRRHFELCARLLACAQRQYLSDAEWDAMDKPVEVYTESIPGDPDPETSLIKTSLSKPFESCSTSDFVGSPWISHVGLPLWSHCDNLLSREASQASQVSSESPNAAMHTDLLDIQYFASVLGSMSDKMYDGTSKLPIPFLQLVSACAETFPLGQCWTSNTQSNWHAFTPDDLLTEDKAYCNGCSSDDIALVVSLVANILEAFGGPNGNVQTQRWALTCLIRLTESSALVALACERKGESSSILHVVWQRVWNALFRTDLRYASYTQDVTTNSIGELVMVLLTEIVRQKCTDPLSCGKGTSVAQRSTMGEFVHANQNKVWNLEAFADGDAVLVPAVFDLIGAILRNAGLSEDGRDLIDGSRPMTRPDSDILRSIPTLSRRFRLVAFCLRFLERTISRPVTGGSGDPTEVACSCLLALLTGKSTPCLSTFDMAASVGFGDRGAFRQFFCVTDIPVDRRDLRNRDSSPPSFLSFLSCLWDEIDAVPKSWFPDSDSPSIEFDDSELTVSRKLLDLARQGHADRLCDFVSPTIASDLHKFVTEILMKMAALRSDDSDDNYEFDESAMREETPVRLEDMVYRVSVLKLLLTVAFSSADDVYFKQSDMDLVAGLVSSTLDEIVTHFPNADQEDALCATLLTNLYQILQGLSVISLSVDAASIPDALSSKFERLFYTMRRFIEQYSDSRALVQLPPSEPRERHGSALNFSDDEDEPEEREQAAGFESDSDDESDFEVVGNKRHRPGNNGTSKRKKRRVSDDSASTRPCNCPSSVSAKIIASILVLLQPSYGVCRKVAEAIALSRVDESSRRRGSDSFCDADVDACLHCLSLFCSPLVLHRKQSLDADPPDDALADPDMDAALNGSLQMGTIFSLCNDLVQGIRAAAGPASNQYLFGFEAGAYLVHQREYKGCGSLVSSERHDIIEIMLPDEQLARKALKRRPDLRKRQLATATSIFRDAQDKLHKAFDPRFKEVMMPKLRDVSAPVRKQAASAVGAALRSFTGQANVVKTVKNNLPPLYREENGSLSGQFREFWDEQESSDAPHPVWKGVFYSLQSFAIETNGVIAGTTTEATLSRKSLFDLVRLATERPDLEALCYLACEKAAGLIGFGTVRDLFLSENEYICDKWLDLGKSLFDLPLLLTAPTVLFQLLLSGSAKFLFGRGAIELSEVREESMMNDARFASLTEVKTWAAKDFIVRSASFLVPIICMKNATSPTDDDNGAPDYLAEVTKVAYEKKLKENPDDTPEHYTTKLLHAHFDDILAFVEPFLHCADEGTRKYGQRVVSYMKRLLPDDNYDKLRKKKARGAVHQLLHHWGKGGSDFDRYDLSKEVILEAIMNLAQESTNEQSKQKREPFAVIGSSVTEYILHGRFWLSQSILETQKERRWSAIELVLSLVLKYIRSGARLQQKSQVGYCIHTILDILADPTLSPVYPSALETLNDFLSAVLDLKSVSSATDEISPVFHRLVGTLVKTHERNQDALMEECLSSWKHQRELLHRSAGLRCSAIASRQTTGDVWGWDADSASSRGERIATVLADDGWKAFASLFKTLERTHTAIERLLDNENADLREGATVPIECLSKFSSDAQEYKPLYEINQKLCARSIAGSFLDEGNEKSNTQTLQECVMAFLTVSATLLASHLGSRSEAHELGQGIHEIAHVLEQKGHSTLSIDFRLLLDELIHVQKRLVGSGKGSESTPMQSNARLDVDQTDLYSLVTLLLKLCETSYPEGIRAAASRCLGALGPSDMENLASAELELSENDSKLFQAPDDYKGKDKLLPRIKVSCLELLSQYLLSPRPETAIAALEAAKAILVSNSDLEELLDDEYRQKILAPLKPMKQKQSAPKAANFAKPDDYLEAMLEKFTAGDVKLSTTDDLSWCWHEALWTLDRNGTHSYEEWVKFITCAMISCCFVDDDEVEEGTEVPIRGSDMFFRYCIKLCALEHDFAAKAFKGIVMDLLLHGIEAYFEAGSSPNRNENDSQSLATYHLSRCFTVLMNSASRSDGGESAPTSQALSLVVETIDIIRFIMQKSFEGSKRHRKNHDAKPEKKKGPQIPNGIILHLDGLSVARACMQTNRFASALFYADMHSDKCYGSAASILERLANGRVSSDKPLVDISGFDPGDGKHSTSDGEAQTGEHARDEKVSLSTILYESFTALSDNDAAGAVNLESAAMSFLDDGFKWNASNSSKSDALERLKAFDLQCQDENGRVVASQQVLDCMEDIGLESVPHTYTAGLVANQCGSASSFSHVEQSSLRERWFRGRLKSMQWDGEIFSSSFAQEPPHNQVGLSGPVVSEMGFHEGLSKALSSFMKDDVFAFRQFLSEARCCLIEELPDGRAGETLVHSIVTTVEKLQFLNDIENVSDGESCKTLASKWQKQSETALGGNVVEFPATTSDETLRLGESVTWAREIMLRAFQAKKTNSREDLKDSLISHLWQIGSVARLVGRSDLAGASAQRLHSALRLKHAAGLPEHTLLRVRLEEAMIMESHGDFSSAIRSLKLLSSHLKGIEAKDGQLSPRSEALYADSLLSCGEWMNRYKVEPGRAILDTYLNPARELADAISGKDSENELKVRRSYAAHLALARLASDLFESACKIVESPEWAKAGANIDLKQSEVEACKSMVKEAKASKKRKSSSLVELANRVPAKEKELKYMENERSKTENSVPLYLELALKSYCNALIHASNGEPGVQTHVYRLISLWFGNSDRNDNRRSETANRVMKEMLPEVPSFRFVPLTYQIFARIASGTDDFQHILKSLVRRMCAEHPYHCIVQLIALSNGREAGAQSGANLYRQNVDDGKIECANEILEDLKTKEGDRVNGLVISYENLVKNYIAFALASITHIAPKDRKNAKMSTMGDRKANLSKNLSARAFADPKSYPPCILTQPPAINPSGWYGEGVHGSEPPAGSEFVQHFDMTFEISAKGRSRPKFIYCRGSKGTAYRQVVKGNDDIRGDAVMQQVFCFVNSLMKRRNGTSKRSTSMGLGSSRALKDQLKIVTFHIVPLSPAAGVLEFVKDSVTIGDYLTGTGKGDVGAHSRYYPGEIGFWAAQKKLELVDDSKLSESREVYEQVCQDFSPAFRYFFTERFGHSLPLWYAAKMKYTRSCAVNSIVGHMLGIGDRHINNILIQKNTGECVHIDFGVIFEQGTLLGTPETVPFRLTRNIVDPMGPCGTEGSFSRAAEETTLVLRENTNSLLTILEAVVADPLFNWNLTPREAKEIQRTEQEEEDGDDKDTSMEEVDDEADEQEATSDQKNEAALRAIRRIEEKLQGFEDGVSGERQSVEGQVQLLINSARDDDNLSRLYYGWGAFA